MHTHPENPSCRPKQEWAWQMPMWAVDQAVGTRVVLPQGHPCVPVSLPKHPLSCSGLYL
jgi:hypothetical protein